MKGFVTGLIVGLIFVPLFALVYVYLGYAPVATAAPPFPFERQVTSIALKARIAKEAPAQAAIPVNEENLMAGAHTFKEYCAVCHGLPGQPKTPTAQGMYPPPPQLFQHGVTDDPPGETYWKVTNGIRLTGMPAYSALSDTERWQVSLMLANADKLSPAVKQFLSLPPAAK